MSSSGLCVRCGRRRLWGLGLILVLALSLLPGTRGGVLAQADPAVEFFQLLNGARLDEGLTPLALSRLLSQAAQRHAEDLAARGALSHEGTDGSNYRQRIREARYDAWNEGLLVAEVFWMGLGGPADSVNWFRNNPESWAALTDPSYREIGIGYAEDGGIRFFVVNLGSRPGVIPVFINDGAEFADSPVVAIRLTNEEAVPLGQGSWIGRAIEVRLSNTPEFEGTPWQPWESLLPWMLEGTDPGEYVVYVQYRDGAGRTAVAADAIQLVLPGEMPLLPSRPSLPLDPLEPDEPPILDTPGADPIDSEEPPIADPTPAPEGPTPEVVETLPEAPLSPQPTWTPLPLEGPALIEAREVDWIVIVVVLLHGFVLLLGLLALLRQR